MSKAQMREAQLLGKVAAMVQKKQDKAEQRILNFKLGDAGLVAFSSFSYDSGVGLCNLANNISQGAGLSQRLGNDVRLKRLRAHLLVQAGDNYNCCRALVIASRGIQSSTTTSTFTTQVFSGVTGSAQVTAPVDSLSFDVLYDKVFTVYKRPLDGSSATTVAPPEPISFDLSLQDRLVTYNQAGVGFAGKPVWILLVSDSAAIAHAGCVEAGIRLEFTSA